ncbi:MAG TPA: META domain-containing protein [Chitinophagaceae bacterium]
MSCILKVSTFVSISFCMIACNSGENDNASDQSAGTNSSITPLIVPNDAAQTTATPTIYDIWVLDSINNKAPDSNFFSHGTPYLDFNLEKKTLAGHTGCNGISGKVNVQGEKLIFDSLVVTSQTCKNKDFEKKFVTGFKSGKTTYKLLNGNLHLNVGPGTNLIFRKIRR